jgi:hypothetical protein
VSYYLIRSKSCCTSAKPNSICEQYPVSQKERYGMLPMVEIKLSKSFHTFCYLLAVSQFLLYYRCISRDTLFQFILNAIISFLLPKFSF